MGEGRRAGEWVGFTVEDAAAALGMTTGAVRNRLSQGTLRSIEEHGTVYVLLPADASRDTARDTGDIPGEFQFLAPADTSRDTAQEETAEELTQEPAQEEAPSVPPEAPKTATPQPGPVEPRGQIEDAQVPVDERRSWWSRIFGG